MRRRLAYERSSARRSPAGCRTGPHPRRRDAPAAPVDTRPRCSARRRRASSTSSEERIKMGDSVSPIWRTWDSFYMSPPPGTPQPPLLAAGATLSRIPPSAVSECRSRSLRAKWPLSSCDDVAWNRSSPPISGPRCLCASTPAAPATHPRRGLGWGERRAIVATIGRQGCADHRGRLRLRPRPSRRRRSGGRAGLGARRPRVQVAEIERADSIFVVERRRGAGGTRRRFSFGRTRRRSRDRFLREST